MSTTSQTPESGDSTCSWEYNSPLYVPPRGVIDPVELDRRLRCITPHVDEFIETWKAECQRNYDRIIALGGRPSRPIRTQLIWKLTMVDGMYTYFDEDNQTKMHKEPDIFAEEDGLVSLHWSKENSQWREELELWETFKKDQRQGLSETGVELENTEDGLADIITKLKNWQDFQSFRQRKLHTAELTIQMCHEGIARIQGVTVDGDDEITRRKIKDPDEGWTCRMSKALKQLDACRKEILWVKCQWTEVLAEISHAIDAAPNLQEQVEDIIKKQTNAIHRYLQERGATPSRAVQPPNETATFAQRLEHWFSEGSVFTAEARYWRKFMEWRRRVKGVDAIRRNEKQSSQDEVRLGLIEDLVEYREYELNRVRSWPHSWRRQAQHYKETEKKRSLQDGSGSFLVDHEDSKDDDGSDNASDSDSNKEAADDSARDFDEISDDDYKEARALAYTKREFTEAEEAQNYAIQAEQKVLEAEKTLKRAEQQLHNFITYGGQAPIDAIPEENGEAQLPSTPPDTQSPDSDATNRDSSKMSEVIDKDVRRSKKKAARKHRPEITGINTEQKALPTFSPYSSQDISGSDEDAHENLSMSAIPAVPDVKDNTHYPPSPSSSSKSDPMPITKPESRERSFDIRNPSSKKTRSSTSLDRATSNRVSKAKHTSHRPNKKAKSFTEKQATTLLDAASTSPPMESTNLDQEVSNGLTNHRKTGKHPDEQSPSSKKPRPSTNPSRPTSNRVSKSKHTSHQPNKKAKTFTENQVTQLLDAASPTSPPIKSTNLNQEVSNGPANDRETDKQPDQQVKAIPDQQHTSPNDAAPTNRPPPDSTELHGAVSGKIRKNRGIGAKRTEKRKKKKFTDREAAALLDASSEVGKEK